jgi:glycosyltransferase involved in cell wall biosynthesis
MKACFIVKYPPIEGGVSKTAYWTARELAERGHQIFVVTNANEVEDEYRMYMDDDDRSWYEPTCEKTGGFVKVRLTQPMSDELMHIPQSNPFVTKLSSVAAQVVRHQGCEVIFGHYLEPYGFAAYLASQWTGVPFMVKHAGSDFGRLMKQRDLRTAYREILKAANCVWSGLGQEPFLAIGVKEENLFKNTPAKLPSIFSPETEPLDLNAFLKKLAALESARVRDLMINTNPIDLSKPTIGIYGKVGKVKGSFDLISALGDLKRRGLEFNFVALTQGRSQDLFKAAIKEHDLQDRSWMFPFIPHWRVPGFLRACTAVCFLERDFPISFHTPTVPNEVLACGTCLVLSGEILNKQPRKSKLVDGSSVLIVDDPKDHEDLARQLAVAITDPSKAAAIGLQGRKVYDEHDSDIKRAKTHIEKFEDKLIEIRNRGKYPAAAVESPEAIEARRREKLKKRLPATFAVLNGRWDQAVGEFFREQTGALDNQFKDAVAFCDFLQPRLTDLSASNEYLPDVVGYERTRNLLLTDLNREPSSRKNLAPGGFSENSNGRNLGRRDAKPGKRTFDEIRLVKPVKTRGVRVEAFDFDLRTLIPYLKKGMLDREFQKQKSFVLFKKELNSVNIELQISVATKHFLDLCDGAHTIEQITREVVQACAPESRPEFEKDDLQADVARIVNDMFVKGIIRWSSVDAHVS